MVHVSNKSRNEMEFHCLFVAFALLKSAADGVGEKAMIDWLWTRSMFIFPIF